MQWLIIGAGFAAVIPLIWLIDKIVEIGGRARAKRWARILFR
jgi:hypothetical protein